MRPTGFHLDFLFGGAPFIDHIHFEVLCTDMLSVLLRQLIMMHTHCACMNCLGAGGGESPRPPNWPRVSILCACALRVTAIVDCRLLDTETSASTFYLEHPIQQTANRRPGMRTNKNNTILYCRLEHAWTSWCSIQDSLKPQYLATASYSYAIVLA